ncbi:hypothetical protein LK492_19675, partial [Phocaeicola vulgatus]|nr:hypothetical protein [Phocaeicola vulgatus]
SAAGTFGDQQHAGFHGGETLIAFRANTTSTNGIAVVTNTGINDFGVRILAKRAMHVPRIT